MSKKQLRRYEVLEKAIAGFITVQEASSVLCLSGRQIKRLKKKVREEGATGVIHKNSMRRPKHALPFPVKDKILQLRKRSEYMGSNFRHFRELLSEVHEIEISYSALYSLLKEQGIRSPKTQRRFKTHRRRERKPQAGLLVQVDASPFTWIIGDKSRYTLHGGIDDATGQITGLYICKNECLHGYFEMFKRTVGCFGIPVSVYADRHTIFQVPGKENMKTDASDTQLGRALKELNIFLIAAHSPQAKGRIERLWQTLQSRLPVELAIRGVTTIDKVNEFLKDYVYIFNSQFAVEPQDGCSMFKRPDDAINLDYVFCIKELRVVDTGGVFSYRGRSYKVCENTTGLTIPSNSRVSVLIGFHFGIKVEYRNFIFDVLPYIPPKRVKKPKPEAKPRVGKPIPADHYYKGGQLLGGKHIFGESDADILQMLNEVFEGTVRSREGDFFSR